MSIISVISSRFMRCACRPKLHRYWPIRTSTTAVRVRCLASAATPFAPSHHQSPHNARLQAATLLIYSKVLFMVGRLME